MPSSSLHYIEASRAVAHAPMRRTHACSAHSSQKPSCSVGQFVNLRRIVNPPAARHPACLGCGDAALWGSQSWLPPAFSRRSSPRVTSVSAARDAPEGIVYRSCERAFDPPAPRRIEQSYFVTDRLCLNRRAWLRQSHDREGVIFRKSQYHVSCSKKKGS